MILPVPPEWNWPPEVHVCIGCISGHNRWPDLDAHSHLSQALRGWICVTNPAAPLYAPDGRAPSWVLLHELAHVMAGHYGHTRTWRRIYAELCPGCPLRPWEQSFPAKHWTRTRTSLRNIGDSGTTSP